MPEMLPTAIRLPDELRSPRLRLRPLRPDDADAIFAAIDESREHLRPWMLWVDNHRSVDDTRDWCAHVAANWLTRSELMLGMFDAASRRYLGGTGLHVHDWNRRLFEVGYWVRASEQGKGYVTEAVTRQIAFAFGELDARRLELWCDARNERSRAVAARCGFVYEGRLRNAMSAPDDATVDALVFSLTPADRPRPEHG
ncbi:MAG TPA: GNAT family N-acetyltransferase [Thermomicrobiales bacterium]|nr:GNAT family N-acetyltransferase [Thermomicrobiales bacterium]